MSTTRGSSPDPDAPSAPDRADCIMPTGRTMPAGRNLPTGHDHPALPQPRPASVLEGLVDLAERSLPAPLWPEPRVRLLVAGWLSGFRSPRTRRAYAGDLLIWQRWCTAHEVDPVRARRVQLDLYLADLLDSGAAPASAGRRLSAVSSFYRFLLDQDDLDLARTNPAAAVRRPAIDAQHSPTLGLTRDEAVALLAAVDRARSSQQRRNAAVLRLLLHNALRVDELLGADLAELGRYPGRAHVHDTLTIRRKGGRRARIALAPDTHEALHRYIEHRATVEGCDQAELTGPLLASRAGLRLTPKAVWVLVRRTARDAGIGSWAKLSPHSLRHTAITLALDAGAPLRDVQDFAGHRDARTTRRYDRAREDLDRSPTYALSEWLAIRPSHVTESR